MMDNPKFIVSDQMEESINIERVKERNNTLTFHRPRFEGW